MAKITLNASPTFELPVDIAIPGKGVGQVLFTFKHRTKSQLEKMFADNAAKGDKYDQVAATLEIVSGWNLDDDFNRENVDVFLDNYPGAGLSIMLAYSTELQRFKVGN